MPKSAWNTYTDQTVLLTGASSGIGLAMAHELSRRGARLILTARSEDKLNETAGEIRAAGNDAQVFAADLSVPGAAETLYARICQAGLKVELLINNAGYGRWGEFSEFERPDYAKMIQLNIIALTELCHLCIPDMLQRGRGGIINVGSVASFCPVPYANVYASTKAYVLMFTEALRYEYPGLRSMALCPGATSSNFAAVAMEKAPQVGTPKETMTETMTETISGSVQSSEEVAKECFDAFLKDKMTLITGKQNRIMYRIIRLLSRKTTVRMVGKIFQRLTGN